MDMQVLDKRNGIVLESVIRREGRSILQYVVDAFPWITSQEQPSLRQLQTMAAEERQSLCEIADFLTGHRHSNPQLGPYPMSFTTINYTSLEHLLPILTAKGRVGLASLEQDLAQVEDTQARDLLDRYLTLKRGHLTALEKMAADNPEVASTRR
jgi:hypothetical protein